jgi:hypothetical protein
MAQKLRDDKIGTLSHGGGIISMAASSSNPAWLTIGGQQYRVTSALARTIASDITLAANTLYMVYAAVSSGTVVMRISTNVNSIGPSSFSSWKLLGAFLTNFNSAFGQFIETDSLNPALHGRAFIGNVNIANNAAAIITGYAGAAIFFDGTNGFFRAPLAGNYELIGSIQLTNNALGAPNTLTQNLYMLGGIKNTVPANALDATDNFGQNNGPWYSSTDTSRSMSFQNNLAVGSYAWLTYQSNLHPEIIGGATFTYKLLSIATKIKDL